MGVRLIIGIDPYEYEWKRDNVKMIRCDATDYDRVALLLCRIHPPDS
ncbi:MAG: hypothetical protein HY364_03440 [Candidatus Aenigmarchaeota archaeon]|nr:hypothetical protein [Candidatus Aenigmarchaeota archaeon]